MKIKIPMHLLGSWLLSLTLFLAVSVPVLAQSEITDALLEAERFEQQALEPAGAITGQNSNRPMAFPDPYCEVSGFSTVEAITRVIFSDIDNTSAASSAVSHEDFTSVVGNVDAGETYTFTLEGYTGGTFSNYVIVWVDWDQDGVFNESTERYDIGVIANSTGEDGVQVSEDIEVPADAVVGETRMRVMKRFGSTSGSATSCAGATSWGQAEDYTVEVSGGGNAGETCDAPIVVASLPFDDAGNTADYGNNYSSGDVPPVATGAVTTGTGSSLYLTGDDVVYAYTPADDEVLNISTTNDDDWIGLWAFTGCPFTSTVGYHTATGGSTRSIEGLPVTAGETYYFVISTWPSPQSTDYTIHIEKVSGGGGDNFVCDDQFNVTNGIENGLFFGGSTNQQLAVDIIVGDDGFTAYGSNLNIFLAVGQTTDDVTVDVTFYDDQAGLPGNVVHSSAGTVKSTEFVGSTFGYDVYTFEVAFDDAADFDANTTYWMSVDSNGEAWEATSSGIFGAGMAFFNDNTSGNWIVDSSEDLVYSLICEEFEDNDYCIPQGTNANRYINNFSTTGGSENISNMGSGFSPDGYGDFYDTHTVAQAQGEDVEFEVDIVGGTAGFRVWVDWNQDGVFDTTEEVAYASSGYSANHTGSFTVPADALVGDTRMRIVSHWLSTTGDVDPCETGFTYGEFEDYKFTVEEGSGGGGGTTCEQVFYDAVQPTGVGFSSGNAVANDITVAAGESFTLETMTFDVVNLGGEPTEFDLEIFEDNGSGGVGTSTGMTYHFDSSNMTFVENGTFSIYTQYTVTLTLPNIELTADASEDARYWLAIASELSTTGDFTYWVSYDYVTNPDSYPSWQYNDTDGWFEYVDTGGLTKEGIMTVSGMCEGGAGGDGCEWTVIVEDTSWGDEVEWELREDGGGNILLSGSGYGNGYYDEQTVTAEGPLEFWITNDGIFGDNTPTYSVSNGTEVLVSGTLTTADTLIFSDLNCDSGDPGITYCEPELDCSDGDMITNVTFQEIDNTTGCSPNGYGDYTHLVATVESGETYPISVTVGDGWHNESVSVWIDFDNSGTFDEDEFFFIGTGSDEALTGDIDIPTELAEGQYRMRVRVAAVGAGTATWDMACDESQGYGETEDYTVEVGIGGGDPCDAVDVPYVQDFETATPPDMPECTTVVNAGSGNNWKTSTDEYGDFTGTFLEYEYHASAPANSWFFTQGINLEAGTDYEITYGYGSRAAAAFPENLKVAFGDDNDPDAMTNLIAEHVAILSGGDKIMNTVEFTATTSGVFYFGFQAFSGANEWYLYLDDIEIKEADGSPGGDDCDQRDDSNGFENAYNITAGGTFRNADDFIVSAGNTLNVRSIVLNVFANEPVSSVNINFFEDDGGMPGSTIVESVSGLVPYAQVPIGSNFGYTIYGVYLEVDLNFAGGASGASYWMQPEAVTDVAFWEVTSLGSLGELIHTSEAMGPWMPDEDGVNHAVFKLHCEVVTAPDPGCLFDITASVEPITRVVLAGIDNTSSAVVNGSPALEDFTHIEGTMGQGTEYDIALEGNTDGNWTNYFTVWIDWDQNGVWEADEMYEIGSITNSTGTDGQQATGTITVPADAPLGSTTMRVIKSFGSSPTDPCGQYSFGQGEDYTIIVEEGVGIDDQSMTTFTYYPNPTSGIVNITANKDISSVSVVNILGQQVIATKSLDNGQVDLSALATGTYMFRVTFEDGSLETFKVLKE